MLKKEVIKTVILLCVSNILFAQIPTDYTGYWSFDGEYSDESSNNISSVFTGGTPIYGTDRNGNENSAIILDGIDDCIVLNNSQPVITGLEFTIACWAKINGQGGGNYNQNTLFEQRDEGGSSTLILSAEVDNISKIVVRTSTSGAFTIAETTSLSDGEWHFYVGVLSENTLDLYIDKVLVHSVAFNYDGNLTNSVDHVDIGRHRCCNQMLGYFNGLIDDFYIYNRALTPSEITDLYNHNSSAVVTTPGLWSENGSDIYRLTGNVGIGTTDPGSYKLAVEGIIGAHEIKVTTDGWADFVFEENYSLMSLSELDAYIKANRHLPEIPTTEEVEENGISVGEMNAKLLQKIEELTLYLIYQNNKMEEFRKELNQLKKENEILKQQVF